MIFVFGLNVWNIMKILYLDTLPQCFPRYKYGLETAALIGSIGAIGLGAYGSYQSGQATNQALSNNKEENEKNRKFNHQEAVDARSWQENQTRQNQAWQEAFTGRVMDAQQNYWKEQQDYSSALQFDYWKQQQDYYSPQQQVQRLNAAGFNASAMNPNANPQGGLSPASSIPSSSAPGVATPSASAASANLSPVASMEGFGSSFGSIASGLGGLVSAITEGDKNSAEANKLRATLQPFIDNMVSDTRFNTVRAEAEEFMLGINKETRDYLVTKAGLDLQELAINIKLKESGIDVNSSIIDVNKAYEKLLDVKEKLTDNEFRQGEVVLGKLSSYYQSIINKNNAGATESYANAALSKAQAQTADAVREYIVEIQKAEAGIKSNDKNYSDNTWHKKFTTDIEKWTNEAIQSGLINDEIGETIKTLQSNRHWKPLEVLLNAASSGAFVTAAIKK